MPYRESLVQHRYRLRKELRRKLECAAKDSDRSVNDEIARRLEESFRHDELHEQFSRWLLDAQTQERMLRWSKEIQRDEIRDAYNSDGAWSEWARNAVGMP